MAEKPWSQLGLGSSQQLHGLNPVSQTGVTQTTGFYWTHEKMEFISGDQFRCCVGCKCKSKGLWLMSLRTRTSPASLPAATFPGLMLPSFSKLHCCDQNGTRWRNELSLLALNQRRPDAILKPVGDSSKHFLQTLKHRNIISHKSSTIFLSTLSAKYLQIRSKANPKKIQIHELSSCILLICF